MFGKKFSEYLRFDRWILVLVFVAFVTRFLISQAGASFTQVRWLSVNVVLLVGLIYCSIAVHTRGFGSYKQLFGLLLVQTVFAHLLIVSGIVLGIVSGKNNIYTIPEVTGGIDGRTWIHVVAHLVAGPVLTVITWLIGSAILFFTKKLKTSVT